MESKKNIEKDIYKKYLRLSDKPIAELYKKFNSSEKGLPPKKVEKLLKENGKNKYINEKKHTFLYFLLISFKDPFIIILYFLAIINYFLADIIGSIIIFSIGLISALIRFFQDYEEYKFNQKLKSKIYSTAVVVRNGKEIKIKTENVVIGDIVKLNAGAIVPADLVLIDSKDLYINESVFTGESVPVEKGLNKLTSTDIFEINNILLMNSSVISGEATGLVINTGTNTYIGCMGNELVKKKAETSFDKGMKSVTKLLINYMIGTVIFVLVVDGIIKGNIKESILFALSVAVGITPSMLPMIVNVNLTKGSKSLARKKTLVKRIESIENLGAIDTLCTDKTGTLTENNITLQKYINVQGEEDINILKYAYLNSIYSTGIKNIVDKAIISYAKINKMTNLDVGYEKIDEIPFDYNRKKQSIVVKSSDGITMYTKGALEVILDDCDRINYKNNVKKITKDIKDKIIKSANELASSGMQVIALSEKILDKSAVTKDDEKDMIFVGFVGFLDPPKKDVKKTLKLLKEHGITIKILTGDSSESTKAICDCVGLESDKIITGEQLDKLSDRKLSSIVEEVNVFTRLNPIQKERVVKILKLNNHVVGYMGDGVNDAPSLHIADVGISVDKATDIAKEASDLILLEQSLNVIYDGVIEGRKVYGNIIKYMKMALSDDFGDVFSIMIASIFLPFLPLLPIQMLFQDFIYDFSQIGIPYDNVDKEFLEKPKKWNISGISRFMFVMGIASSIVDCLSFIVFYFILKYNNISMQSYFQTSWFVLCLLTELLVIHNVRTAHRPFIDSCASKKLTILTIVSMILTIFTPILLSTIPSFGFVILPLKFYLWLIILLACYIFIVSIIKHFYIKRYKEWL